MATSSIKKNFNVVGKKACPMNIILLFLLLASSFAFSGASNEDFLHIHSEKAAEDHSGLR